MSDRWQVKPWGSTREVFRTPHLALHTLRTVAGGFCSIHWHAEQANRFIVRAGTLAVLLFDHHLRETGRTVLTAGQWYDVPAKMIHQFESLEDSHVWELYWPIQGRECRRNDIVRLREGGRLRMVGYVGDVWHAYDSGPS